MLHEPIIVPASEEEQVRELHRVLKLGTPALVGPHEERVELPESVYRILKDVVRNMQVGRAVMIVPSEENLTTQKVANILGVSRPYVVKLLDSGKIPSHKTGSHRRVYLKDAMSYMRSRDLERRTVLATLAKTAYEEGLYAKASVPVGGDDE